MYDVIVHTGCSDACLYSCIVGTRFHSCISAQVTTHVLVVDVSVNAEFHALEPYESHRRTITSCDVWLKVHADLNLYYDHFQSKLHQP